MAIACPYTPNVARQTDPDAALTAYANWIADVVVPRARKEAPVLTDTAHTALDGVSLGGFVGDRDLRAQAGGLRGVGGACRARYNAVRLALLRGQARRPRSARPGDQRLHRDQRGRRLSRDQPRPLPPTLTRKERRRGRPDHVPPGCTTRSSCARPGRSRCSSGTTAGCADASRYGFRFLPGSGTLGRGIAVRRALLLCAPFSLPASPARPPRASARRSRRTSARRAPRLQGVGRLGLRRQRGLDVQVKSGAGWAPSGSPRPRGGELHRRAVRHQLAGDEERRHRPVRLPLLPLQRGSQDAGELLPRRHGRARAGRSPAVARLRGHDDVHRRDRHLDGNRVVDAVASATGTPPILHTSVNVLSQFDDVQSLAGHAQLPSRAAA